MSSQSKILTIGLVLAFGIGNAYYAFNPSFKELKEQREGGKVRDLLQPANAKPAAAQPESKQQQDSSS